MSGKRNDEKAEKMYSLYKDGASLAKVAIIFKITPQGVYKMFKLRGYKLRAKRDWLPFIKFNGEKYSLTGRGYYVNTARKKRGFLHRHIWELEKGKIPMGFQIHHKDGNKVNNAIENLELISAKEHSLYHLHRCPECGYNFCKK